MRERYVELPETETAMNVWLLHVLLHVGPRRWYVVPRQWYMVLAMGVPNTGEKISLTPTECVP